MTVEFDASYPGNERWEEALDVIDSGTWDLHGDISYEDDDSEIYFVQGEDAEVFCDIYNLTTTDNYTYRLWKTKGNTTSISKLKKDSMDELNSKLEDHKREITQFLSEIKPLWKEDLTSKSDPILTRFHSEVMKLTNEKEENL